MPYALKRLFQICFAIFILAFAMWIVVEVRLPQNFIYSFLYPTICFIPIAILATKFRNKLTSRKKAVGGFGAVTGMFLGNIIAKSASENMKVFLLVFCAELMILMYYIFYTSYNERNQLQQLGFQRISSREFKTLTKSLGFKRFDEWFSPATRDHYTGMFQCVNACVFSFPTNGPAYLAVILYSDNWHLPVFQVKPKSFSDNLKSMLGNNNENDSVKQTISDDYFFVSDTTSTLSSLPPELVAEINKSDSIELEITRKALLLYDIKKFTDEPENYENAIQQGYLYASMFFAHGTLTQAMRICPTSGVSSQAAAP